MRCILHLSIAHFHFLFNHTYVNMLVKLPKSQLFSLSLYFNYCAPQLPDASVLFLQRPIYKREKGAPV